MMELDGDITQCYRTPEPTLNQIIIALTAPYSEMLFSKSACIVVVPSLHILRGLT